MDKDKVKEALKKKLKKEMSMTGTGASVTPGVGASVATKYAFGKSNNKGTPKDWKEAPSIPNRKSKAMDYKELWEVDEAYDKSQITTNAEELARVEELLAQANKDNAYSVMTAYENRIAILRFIVFLEKKLGKQLPVLNFGRNFGEYLKKELGYIGPIKQNRTGAIANFRTISDTILNNQNPTEESINENYARFRNETKTRTKPEQFHSAVKQVKQKVNEINRLFEYMNRLQSELSESEGGLKHKKYTDKAIQSIKESTKQLFFKSTKLK